SATRTAISSADLEPGLLRQAPRRPRSSNSHPLAREETPMRIGIVGGTGKEGSGLGIRWALAGHEVLIGSRDPERARGKAAELAARAPGARVSGMSNLDAVTAAEIVVLTVPANGLAATLPDVREACRGKIVVSTVVPLTFGGGRLFTPPSQGSSAEEAQEILGPEAKVVASFHHIAAHE